MDFKRGDKVKIISDKDLLRKGNTARIMKVYDGYYKLDIDNGFYAWQDKDLVLTYGF